MPWVIAVAIFVVGFACAFVLAEWAARRRNIDWPGRDDGEDWTP